MNTHEKPNEVTPDTDPVQTEIKPNEVSIVPSLSLDTEKVASPPARAANNGLIKGKLSVLQQELLTKETIVPKTCDEYVSDFKLCAAKTARAILEMCRIVYEAKDALDRDGTGDAFEQFCDQIGMAKSPATVVKFCCIGRVYARFIKYEDRLPTSWTSIYLLTQVPAQYFDQMIAKNKSLADLTGNQINWLMKQTLDLDVVQTELPKDGKTKRPVFGKIVFTKEMIDDLDYAAMKKAMQEIEARLPVKFLTTPAADAIFEKRMLERYERQKKKLLQPVFTPDLREFSLSPILVTAEGAPAEVVPTPVE